MAYEAYYYNFYLGDFMKPVYASIVKILMRIMNITLFLVGIVLCGAVVGYLNKLRAYGLARLF